MGKKKRASGRGSTDRQGKILSHIAQSLARQYVSIYYIDTRDDSYVEFASSDKYKSLNIEPAGSDFFEETRRNNMRLIHPDDIDLLSDVSDKEALLGHISGGRTYDVTYRLLMDSGSLYARLSAMMADDGKHIIVGVADVDEQVRKNRAAEKAEERHATYSHVAQSLARRYATIYYVDAQTRAYVEFSSSGFYRELGIPSAGNDFFADSREYAPKHVHPDDVDDVVAFVNFESLSRLLDKNGCASLVYRLMTTRGPVYASMYVVWADDRRHLIVGVSNVDEQVKNERAARDAEERSRVYGHIAKSLASQYSTIYFVDIYTKGYIEFSSSDLYKSLEVEPYGDDFFETSVRNVKRVIHPDDLDRVLALLDRDRMTEAINRDGCISITYRLMIHGKPVYTNMNAAWADDHRHVIIGVSDVDAQMRHEMEQREAEERSRIYGYIAQSLANQYSTIYYVDVYTESYIEFASTDAYQSLDVPPAGEDFFGESRKNILRVVHPDDVDELMAVLDRDRMTQAINAHGSVSVTYRLMIEGEEIYTNMRAVWADDMRHLIVGVADINDQMKREMRQREAEKRSITYAHIAQSLADRYESIYYVDTLTNSFTEYSSNDEYKNLNVRSQGDDFFAETVENVHRLVYHEDVDFALAALEKSNLLRELELASKFSINYRLMMNGKPTYINLRVVWANDHRHIIVGISNVDAEMKREHEHANNLRLAHEKALRDELCGVRNKNGYQEMEAKMQVAIQRGTQDPFAIVVCDVNGLKEVNDTQGHKAGDQYIKDACQLICDTYSHSPVFRIGGDEFVAVLHGKDFRDRDALLTGLRTQVLFNQDAGQVVVATGMSIYQEGSDRKVSDVFARADEMMYANKRTLKGARM